MNYQCPVCGFPNMEEPPAEYAICICCGTEFGYDDRRSTHEQLRQRWIANGAMWWSGDYPKPANWSAMVQLRNLGHYCDAEEEAQIVGYKLERIS